MLDELVDERFQVHPASLTHGLFFYPGFLGLSCQGRLLVPKVGLPDPGEHGLHLREAREPCVHTLLLEGHVRPEDLGSLVRGVPRPVDERPVRLDRYDSLPGLPADGEGARARKPQLSDETLLYGLWPWA